MGINTDYTTQKLLAFVSTPPSAEIEAARKSLERIFISKGVNPATVAPLIPKLLQIGGVGISFLINEAANAAPVGLEEIPWIRQNSLKRFAAEVDNVGLTDALDRFVMNQDNLPPDISRQDVFAQLHNLKAGINAHHFSRALEAFVYLSAMLGFNQKEFEAGLEALLIHFPEQIQKPTSPNHQQRVDQQRDPPPQSTRRTTNAQHQPKSNYHDTPLTLTLNGQTSQVFFRTTQNSAGSQYSVFYNPGNGVREHKLQAKTLEGARTEFMQLYKQGDLPGMSAGATSQAYNAALTLKNSIGTAYRVNIRQEVDKQFTVNYTIHGQEYKFSLEATTLKAASEEVNKAFIEGRLPGLVYRPPKVETPKPANPASQVEPSVGGMTPEELTTFLGNLGLLQPVEEFLTQNPNATPEQVQQFLSTRLAQNYQAFLEKNGFREYVLQRYGSNPTDEQLIQAERDFLKAHASRNGTANNGSDPNLAEVMGAIAENLMKQDPDLSINDAYYKAGILLNEGGSGGGGGGGKKKTGGSGSNGDGSGDSSGGDGFFGRVNRLYNNPKIQAIGNLLITGSVVVGIGSVAAQWFAASPDIDSSSIDPFKIPLDANGQPDFDSIKFMTPEQILQAGGNKADLNAPSKNGYIDLRALPKEFFYNVDNVKKLRHAINVHFSNQMLAAEMEMLASTGVNLDASALTVLSRQFAALFNRKEFLGSTNDMNHPSYWGRTQPMGVAATQVSNYANQVMRQLDELVVQNRADLWNGTVTGFPADLSILEDKFQFDGINPTEQLINRANNTNVAAHELLKKLTPDNAVILASTTTQEINKLSSDIGVALSTLGTTIKQIEEKNNKLKKYQKELQAEAEQLRKWSGVEPNQITQKLTQIESIYNTNNNAIATIRSQISSLQLQMNGLTNTLTQISLQTAQYAKQVQAYELQQEQLITSQRAVEKQEEAIRTARNNQNQADQNAAYQALGQAITAYNNDVSQDRRPGTPIPTFVFGSYTVYIPPATNTSNNTLSWDNLINGLYSRLFANPDAITYLNKRGAGLPEGEAERKKYIEKLLNGAGVTRENYNQSSEPSSESNQNEPPPPPTNSPPPVNDGGSGAPVPGIETLPGNLAPGPSGSNPFLESNPKIASLPGSNLFFLNDENDKIIIPPGGTPVSPELSLVHNKANLVAGPTQERTDDNILSLDEMYALAEQRNIDLQSARINIEQDEEIKKLVHHPDFRITLGNTSSNPSFTPGEIGAFLQGKNLAEFQSVLTISFPIYSAKNDAAKNISLKKLQLAVAALANAETQVKKQILDLHTEYYKVLSDLEKQQKLVDSLNREIADMKKLENAGAVGSGSFVALEKLRDEKERQIVLLNAQLETVLSNLARTVGVEEISRDQMPPLTQFAPTDFSTPQALLNSQPKLTVEYQPGSEKTGEATPPKILTPAEIGEKLVNDSGWLQTVPVKGKDNQIIWVNANEFTLEQIRNLDLDELQRIYETMVRNGSGNTQAALQIAQILYLASVRDGAGKSGEFRIQFNPMVLIGIVANPLLGLLSLAGGFSRDQTNEREVRERQIALDREIINTLKMGDQQIREIQEITNRYAGQGLGSTWKESYTQLKVAENAAETYYAIKNEVRLGNRSAITKDSNSYGGLNLYEAYRNLVEALYELEGVTLKYLLGRTRLATLSGQDLDDLIKIYDNINLYNPNGTPGTTGVVVPPPPGMSDFTKN